MRSSTLTEYDAIEKEILRKKKIEIVERLRSVTPVKTGRARDGWQISSDSIINDVSYIDRLNEGTSKQAPSYFIESTVLSIPGVTSNGVIVTKAPT